MEFWIDFKAILNSEQDLSNTTTTLRQYHLLTHLERGVVLYQQTGMLSIDLLLYLLKMKTKYSENGRDKLTRFLDNYIPFNPLIKQWRELSKRFRLCILVMCIKLITVKNTFLTVIIIN